MSVPTPAIDSETTQALIQRTAKLAAALTAQHLTPEAAQGQILAVDAVDSTNQVVIAAAGTRIDATIAGQLSAAGITTVQVRGWWPNFDKPDAGLALVELFSRMASQAIDRINQAADKNFLAYLALIGTEQTPPQPARVPLTFYLVNASPADAWVTAGAQAAAQGAAGDIVFETADDLVVTRAQLQAVWVKAPTSDQYSGDYTAVAAGQTAGTFAAFTGDQLIEHSLYLAAATLFGYTGDTLQLTLNTPTLGDAKNLASLAHWEYWDGQAWQTLTVNVPAPTTTNWVVTAAALPALPTSSVNQLAAQWLRARLTAAIAAPFDSGFINTAALDLTQDFYPFGPKPVVGDTCALASLKVLAQAGLSVTVYVTLSQPLATPSGATLTWEVFTGQNWQALTVVSKDPSGNTLTAPNPLPQNFAASGQVVFTLPGTMGQTTVNGQNSYWLRARLTAGTYSQPPFLRWLTLGLSLPTLTTIAAQVTRAVTASPPDKGFANATPLDLTKDFYPFGTRPAFNDTCYLASQSVLSQAGGSVTVLVTLSPGQPIKTDGGATLTWEVFDGQTWRGVTVTSKDPDGGALTAPAPLPQNFMASGQVIFTLPSSMGQGTVNGQKGYWLRVRLTAGNYGTTAQYKNIGTTDDPQYVLSQVENYQPPSLQSVALSASSTITGQPLTTALTYNDFVYADVTAIANANPANGTFQPFTPSAEVSPTLYLGFDRPFANTPTTLYAQVIAPDPGDVSATQLAAIDPTANPPQVVWEYSSAAGWRTLSVADETQTLAESGLVQFLGPADFGAATAFGQSRYWLRARWASGSFLFPPQLGHLLTNTTWAIQSQTLTNETLGSSNGNPSQTFKTAQTPVLSGQVIQVEEPDLPLEADQLVLGVNAISVTRNAAGQIVAVWVQWQAVPNFYRSGPRDRHYMFDPLTGTVTFGDGTQGMVPPVGSNNIRAARYQVGGGSQGNVATGAITQLKSSWPYVDHITNLEAAAGGGDTESLDEVKDRGPRFLRHRGRAVAADDFEDLALAASLEVARAQAIVPPDLASSDYFFEPDKTNPNTPPSGTADRILSAMGVEGQVAKGYVQPGQVGLIIVANSAAVLPAPSPILLQEVRDYIQARCSPTLALWVTGPDWVQVTVTATVVPSSLDVTETLAQTISDTLQQFLHPLTGGLDGQGWPFGTLPHLSTLATLLEAVAGVDYVFALQAAYVADSDPDHVSHGVTDSSELTAIQLIYSGLHVITLQSPT